MLWIIGRDHKSVLWIIKTILVNSSSAGYILPSEKRNTALQKKEKPLCRLHLIFGNQLPLRKLAVSVIIIWWVTASAAPGVDMKENGDVDKRWICLSCLRMSPWFPFFKWNDSRCFSLLKVRDEIIHLQCLCLCCGQVQVVFFFS